MGEILRNGMGVRGTRYEEEPKTHPVLQAGSARHGVWGIRFGVWGRKYKTKGVFKA
jgi:hypothetical protein